MRIQRDSFLELITGAVRSQRLPHVSKQCFLMANIAGYTFGILLYQEVPACTSAAVTNATTA